jgi:hypothetical protein
MSWYRLSHLCLRISVPIVLTTMTDKLTTHILELLD